MDSPNIDVKEQHIAKFLNCKLPTIQEEILLTSTFINDFDNVKETIIKSIEQSSKLFPTSYDKQAKAVQLSKDENIKHHANWKSPQVTHGKRESIRSWFKALWIPLVNKYNVASEFARLHALFKLVNNEFYEMAYVESLSAFSVDGHNTDEAYSLLETINVRLCIKIATTVQHNRASIVCMANAVGHYNFLSLALRPWSLSYLWNFIDCKIDRPIVDTIEQDQVELLQTLCTNLTTEAIKYNVKLCGQRFHTMLIQLSVKFGKQELTFPLCIGRKEHIKALVDHLGYIMITNLDVNSIDISVTYMNVTELLRFLYALYVKQIDQASTGNIQMIFQLLHVQCVQFLTQYTGKQNRSQVLKLYSKKVVQQNSDVCKPLGNQLAPCKKANMSKVATQHKSHNKVNDAQKSAQKEPDTTPNLLKVSEVKYATKEQVRTQSEDLQPLLLNVKENGEKALKHHEHNQQILSLWQQLNYLKYELNGKDELESSHYRKHYQTVRCLRQQLNQMTLLELSQHRNELSDSAAQFQNKVEELIAAFKREREHQKVCLQKKFTDAKLHLKRTIEHDESQHQKHVKHAEDLHNDLKDVERQLRAKEEQQKLKNQIHYIPDDAVLRQQSKCVNLQVETMKEPETAQHSKQHDVSVEELQKQIIDFEQQLKMKLEEEQLQQQKHEKEVNELRTQLKTVNQQLKAMVVQMITHYQQYKIDVEQRQQLSIALEQQLKIKEIDQELQQHEYGNLIQQLEESQHQLKKSQDHVTKTQDLVKHTVRMLRMTRDRSRNFVQE